MDIWKIKDKIKNGTIYFNVGDEIVVFRRKKSGHPRSIKDGVKFYVRRVEKDHLMVAEHSQDGIGWEAPVKVHKYYVMPKHIWREIRLNSILGDIFN